ATRPPTPFSTLFPYTTLFRSVAVEARVPLWVDHDDLGDLLRDDHLLDLGLQVAVAVDRPARLVVVETVQEIDDRVGARAFTSVRSEEHTSELQSRSDLVCRLL